jgi:hypothetical protein
MFRCRLAIAPPFGMMPPFRFKGKAMPFNFRRKSMMLRSGETADPKPNTEVPVHGVMSLRPSPHVGMCLFGSMSLR